MSSLFELVSRVRAWRVWRALRLPLTTPITPHFDSPPARPILREVTPSGVRVYSLCGSCGAHLGASATLCDPCASARSGRRG